LLRLDRRLHDNGVRPGTPMNTCGRVWLGDEGLSAWVVNQTNAALRDDSATRTAEAVLRAAGLPTHPDRTKNWDTFLALHHAMTTIQQSEAILDAGAERYSAFLPALSRCGYCDLTGINLTFGAPQKADGITLRNGDITRTEMASQSYAFIACLSVIEHGVDVAAFLQECGRLLIPNGRLFLSFDYWEEPVDVRGQQAYGAPIRIFTRRDIDEILGWAGKAGLSIEGASDFRCNDRVVHWQRVDLRYTFANLLLRRVSDPMRPEL
jgi:SAM-dependent methyltransferase